MCLRRNLYLVVNQHYQGSKRGSDRPKRGIYMIFLTKYHNLNKSNKLWSPRLSLTSYLNLMFSKNMIQEFNFELEILSFVKKDLHIVNFFKHTSAKLFTPKKHLAHVLFISVL